MQHENLFIRQEQQTFHDVLGARLHLIFIHLSRAKLFPSSRLLKWWNFIFLVISQKCSFFSLALSGRWRSRSFGISYTTGILKTDGMLLYAPQRLAIILWMNRERRVALGEVSEGGVRMTRGKLPMIECTSGFPDSACFMYSEFSFYVAARL